MPTYVEPVELGARNRISRQRVGRPRVPAIERVSVADRCGSQAQSAQRFSFAPTLVPACYSKPVMLNQARLDRRDPGVGLTQRLGAGMHEVEANHAGQPS